MSIDQPDSTTLHSADGTALRLLTYAEHDEARARLLFIHGWAEHAGRYQFPTAYLAPLGYDCYAMDLRGHGHSAGRRGYIDTFDQYLQDVQAGLDHVTGRTGGTDRPTVLIAHSMGGLVVTRYLQTRPIPDHLRGFVISSPFFGLAMEVPAVKRTLGTVMSRIWPSLALDAALDPQQLTKDEDVIRVRDEDPLVFHKACSRWFTEVMIAQDQAVAEAARMHLPGLVMHGADDGIANPGVTRDFFDRFGAEAKTLKLYDNLRHEIFNEVERDQVFADVAAWLDTVVPS